MLNPRLFTDSSESVTSGILALDRLVRPFAVSPLVLQRSAGQRTRLRRILTQTLEKIGESHPISEGRLHPTGMLTSFRFHRRGLSKAGTTQIESSTAIGLHRILIVLHKSAMPGKKKGKEKENTAVGFSI
jgi:hypothetical protein